MNKEFIDQQLGGGVRGDDFLTKYESYLDAEIRKKLLEIGMEEKLHKYLFEIANAKSKPEMDALAEEWGIPQFIDKE